jgi:hypothetical protein
MPPALFALIILELGSHFLCRPVWTTILLFYASCPPWEDDVCHYVLRRVLSWAGLDLSSPGFSLSLNLGLFIYFLRQVLKLWILLPQPPM